MEETKNISEINLVTLVTKLWKKKKFILKVAVIGFIVGLIIAFSIPEEYTATVILTPDSQSSNSGTIGSLAALAGVNINKGTENALTSPNLYPSILNSTTFLKGLFNIQVRENDTEMSLYTYIREYQKIPWWKHITRAPFKLSTSLFSSPDSPPRTNTGIDSTATVSSIPDSYISRPDLSVIDELRGRFSVDYDKKTGITTVEVTMQSPEISSFLADTLTSYLQSYIIEYRTQKARMDLEYTEKLYEESKEDYYKAQANLAAFIDGNMNLVSASYRTTQEKLQNEANLTYSIYNQTTQQLQMAKIKVQNTTPVFTIIQPAVQPFLPVKPNINIIIIGVLLLSFIGAAIWILKKDIKSMLFNNN